MDIYLLLIIGSIVLLAVAIALVLLRRSWGNFPSDARLPTAMQPPELSRSDVSRSEFTDHPDVSIKFSSDDAAQVQTSAPSGGLVLITNDAFRRAAEQALQKGDDSAKYFAQDGDKLYFNADAIPDPEQRQRVAMVMHRLGTDDEIDMRDVWEVVQMLRRS